MATLKELKRTAHHYFDTLWMHKLYYSGRSLTYWRGRQYRWLSKKMGIPREKCHISKFNKEQCTQVIDICAEEFAKNESLLKFADMMEDNKVMQWYKLK